MSLNFQGLGFVFSAVDRGLKAAVRSAVGGFTAMGSAATDLGKYARGATAPLGRMFEPMAAEKLAAIKDGFNHLTEGIGGDFKFAVRAGREELEKLAEHTQQGAAALSSFGETGLHAVGGLTTAAVRFGGPVLTTAGRSVHALSGALVGATRAGVEGIGQMVAGLGRFSASLPTRALDAMRTGMAAITHTAEGTQHAVSSLMSPPSNLTTGLEAQMQAHSVAARRLGVNYGYLDGELRSFTRQTSSMADGLNISDDAAGRAVYASRWAAEEFRGIGLGNARVIAQFGEVTGVNIEQLATNLRQMHSEFQIAPEDLRRITESTVAFGRESGNVRAPLEGLNEMVGQLRTQLAQSGRAMDSRTLTQYALGINHAAQAFYSVSQNGEDARRQALALNTALMNSRRQMGDLFSGVAGDIPEFATSMGIATGDVNQAFALMQESPEGFMRGLSAMVLGARHAGRDTDAIMNQLRSRLDQAVGPEQTNALMTYFRNANEQTLRQAATANNQAQSLSRMARQGFSDGRTAQENFDRMRESFIMGFRSIGRHATGAFIGATSRAFGQFNSQMRDLVHQGGPMAAVIERMSMIHQLGATALLPPELGPFATVFGTAFESMGPTLTALGSMGFRLSSLANPLVLIGGLIGYFGIQFAALFLRTRNAGQAFAQLQQNVQHFADNAVRAVEHAVPLIVQIVPLFLRMLARLGQILLPALVRIGAAVFAGLMQISGQLALWAARINWHGVLQTLFAGLATAVHGALSLLLPVALAILGGLAEAFSHAPGVGESLLNGIAGALESLDFGTLAGRLGTAVTALFAGLGDVDFARAGRSFARMQVSLLNAVVHLVEALPISAIGAGLIRVLGGALDLLSAALPSMLRGTASAIVGLAQVLVPAVAGLVDQLVGFLVHTDWPRVLHPVVDGLADGLSTIVRALPSLAGDLIDAITRGLNTLASSTLSTQMLTVLQHVLERAADLLVNDVLVGVVRVVTRLLQAMPGMLSNWMSIIIRTFQQLPDRISAVLSRLGSNLSRVLPGLLVGLLNGIWNLLRTVPGLVWRMVAALPSVLARIGPMLANLVTQVRNVILAIFDGIRQWLVQRFPQAAGIINTVFGAIRTTVTMVFEAIRTSVSVAFAVVSTVFQAIAAVVRWVAEAMWTAMRTAFSLISDAVSAVGRFFTWVWAGISSAASTAWAWINEHFVQPIGNALGQIGGWFREHFGGAFAWLQQTFDTIAGWFQRQIDRIGSAIRTVRGWLPGGGGSSTPAGPSISEQQMRDMTTQLQGMTAAQRHAWEQSNATVAQAARRQYGHIAALLDATSDAAQQTSQQTSAAVAHVAQTTQASTAAVTHGTESATSALSAFGAAMPMPAFDQIPTRANRALTQAATTAQTSFTAIDGSARTASEAVVTAFESTRDRIVAVFTAIRDAATGPTGTYTAIRTGSTELFTAITTDFRTMWTATQTQLQTDATATFTTLSTAARDSFTTLFGDLRTGVTELATGISELFSQGVAAGIRAAFMGSFNDIQQFVQNVFIRRMTDSMTRLSRTIMDVFRTALLAVVNATESAFRYIQQQTTQVNDAGAHLAAVMQRAAENTAVIQRAAEQTSGIVDAHHRDFGDRAVGDNELYDAIMFPDWYRQYSTLFASKLDALTDAVRNLNGRMAPQGGRTGRTVSADEARASVARFVGAPAGPSGGGNATTPTTNGTPQRRGP